MKREFFVQDEESNKFWIIELMGNRYVTMHGRVGAKGRETLKEFASAEEAAKEVEKLIASKLKKGYVEGSAGEPAGASASAKSSAGTAAKIDWSKATMDESLFWKLIGMFRWKKTGDDDAVIEPAVAALAKMEVAEIFKFADILEEKLFQLDTQAFAENIGADAYRPGKHFSVDLFLYARCVVVANGPDYFAHVLADAKNFPKDMDFEGLLSVAPYAYERKTGDEFDHVSPHDYETFSNQAGWCGK